MVGLIARCLGLCPVNDEKIVMNDVFDLAMPILLVTMCGIALTLTKIAIQIESENSSSLGVFKQGFTPIISYSFKDNPPS